MSPFIRIQDTAKIKLTCYDGFVVPMKYLKRVIQKFENAEHFCLQITLMDSDVEIHDGHAVQLKNVWTNQTFSIEVILDFY